MSKYDSIRQYNIILRGSIINIVKVFQQAINSHQAGQLDEAERLYRKVLSKKPNHPDANHNLGVIAMSGNKPELALSLFEKALQANPQHPQFQQSLARAKAYLNELSLIQPQNIEKQLVELFNHQKYDQALLLAKQSVEKDSNYAFGWKTIGTIESMMQDYDNALVHLKKALILNPNDIGILSNLGIVLKKLGKLGEAEANYREVIRLKPDYAVAYNNLSLVLQDLGKLEEAEACCREAIHLKPDYAEAFTNLGNVLNDLNRLEEAEVYSLKAIALKPDYAEAYINFANVLNNLNRLEEAEVYCREALRLKSDYAEAYNNLGVVLKNLERLEEADINFREAIRLKPDYAEAYNNFGNVLKDLGRLNEADMSYREALRLKPDYMEAYSNLLFMLNYESLPIEKVVEDASSYGLKVSSISEPKFTSWHDNKGVGKLRIGFVSGDLKNHPVGYFLEGLLFNLDKSKFDLIAFPTVSKVDELTSRIKPMFNEWLPIYQKSDFEAARVIHEQKIDILIDLSGHTPYNRLSVFAYKPVQIQISWLGYFATTGLPEMDYILGDPYSIPKHEYHHFTEKVWNLPDSRLCFTPPSESIDILPLPALENTYVTFGNFSNLTKINEVVIETWSTVLKRIPNSKLFLKSKQLSSQNAIIDLENNFAEYGISKDRLILESSSSRIEYMKSYNKIDMVLDTFPFPGGTTSSESLWMGVPVLTLAGDRLISHQGESIAYNTGLSEWVASNLIDYIDKAVYFASDIENLSILRSSLRERLPQTPLFNAKQFAKNFEDALLNIHSETFKL
ncbi:MAG: tetratricopeptide repeat protein [Campylobacterales bacterium]|nr:tetratricopeptide repeat protein [Campylobacterales bacterium]